MSARLWRGLGRRMLPVPGFIWKHRVRSGAQRTRDHVSFMSEEHHLVREFAVRELPRFGKPLSVDLFAGDLNLRGDLVDSILDDLEEHKTFVCRNDDGAVEWAYPVTVAATPHKVTFNTGERLHSA